MIWVSLYASSIKLLYVLSVKYVQKDGTAKIYFSNDPFLHCIINNQLHVNFHFSYITHVEIIGFIQFKLLICVDSFIHVLLL